MAASATSCRNKGFADVVGAGTGDEIPARFQDLQCPQVDLLVAALSRRQTIAVLGKSWGVENDHLEASADLVVFLEEVESIAFAEV